MLHYTWTCACCGRQFHELPIHWSATAPLAYEALSDAEREARAQLSADFCTIDDNAFYIRGQIEIPIIGRSEAFAWGVWSSLSSASMKRALNAWDSPDRQDVGPFFGWLSSALPLYPETQNLKTHIHLGAAPRIPTVELEPTNHPLAVEQREGMTLERAISIAEALLPRH